MQGKECSTEQGDQLRSFVAGIRNKRPATGRGERVKLDVIRKEWRYFLGSVFLGQLCNPFIPRQTGQTNLINPLNGCLTVVYCDRYLAARF